MKTRLLLGLALVLRAGLFCLVLASLSCQSLQNREINKTTSETNGVTVEVSVPDRVSASQPVGMVVNITNVGPQTIYYGEIDGIRELGIRLVDSKNATPELTSQGKQSVTDSGEYYRFISQDLKPGDCHEWRVDLATLFKLQPGTYQVSVNLEFNTHQPGLTPFKISTDPLGFVIQ